MIEEQRKRIYLAGKIDQNDWRHLMVSGLWAVDGGDAEPFYWPTLPSAIMGRFDYVGPFFTDCDHACYHGPNEHGVGYQGAGCGIRPKAPRLIPLRCKHAIASADLVFAWLDSPDAYGTLFELGYAQGISGTTMKPLVAVAYPSSFTAISEMWFTLESVALSYQVPTPEDGIRAVLHDLGWLLESPAEVRFWEGWWAYCREIRLEQQYQIAEGRYRLDFAHPPSKTAIEIDGVTYHGDDKHFTGDRRRDRFLAQKGWLVLRFTAAEVRDSLRQCIEQAASVISGRGVTQNGVD